MRPVSCAWCCKKNDTKQLRTSKVPIKGTIAYYLICRKCYSQNKQTMIEHPHMDKGYYNLNWNELKLIPPWRG